MNFSLNDAATTQICTLSLHDALPISKRNGKRSDGLQRYRCPQCGKTFSDRKQFGPIGHKQIDDQKALLADRKSTRLNSSHRCISYAVFCLKKKNKTKKQTHKYSEVHE